MRDVIRDADTERVQKFINDFKGLQDCIDKWEFVGPFAFINTKSTDGNDQQTLKQIESWIKKAPSTEQILATVSTQLAWLESEFTEQDQGFVDSLKKACSRIQAIKDHRKEATPILGMVVICNTLKTTAPENMKNVQRKRKCSGRTSYSWTSARSRIHYPRSCSWP